VTVPIRRSFVAAVLTTLSLPLAACGGGGSNGAGAPSSPSGAAMSDVTENLRPLRSFLAWSEGTGGSRTFDAFLEIK
jgi:hypothetical protein